MRYLLFGSETYYPEGGSNDLISCGDDLESLKAMALLNLENDIMIDWVHVFDTQTQEIVYDSEAK